MIIAGPSETHAEMALAAIEAGKHTLVEIPIAMNLDGRRAGRGRRRASAASPSAWCTPCGSARNGAPMVERIGRGEERVSHVQGRFFIHRLQNVGATGLQRSWTDNLLWHHTTHLVDFGLWMLSGGDLATVEERIRRVYSVLPADRAADRHPDGAGARGGDPRRPDDRDAPAPTTRGEYIYDTLVVTDRDSYRTDERARHADHRRRRAAHRVRAGERRADRAGLRRGRRQGS